MSTRNGQERARRVRSELGDIPQELAALQEMSHPDLCQRYQEVFGAPTRSRNKGFLRKKIAYRLQELAEQRSLSDGAKAKLEHIAATAPIELQPSRSRRRKAAESPEAASAEPAPAEALPAKGRDPRLPPIGTVLKKAHEGTEHEVKVLEEGFEFRGERYRSLSRIAAVITGTNWNGFLWFGLARRPQEREARP